MLVMSRFDLRLVRAERSEHRIVIGLDVHRDDEHFQYFECWTSRSGDISFGDRQKLVAAAIAAVSDRIAGQLEPLMDPHAAIIVPMQPHPNPPVVGLGIADALLDLNAVSNGTRQASIVHTVEMPAKPTLV
jgi:hypothetical protein